MRVAHCAKCEGCGAAQKDGYVTNVCIEIGEEDRVLNNDGRTSYSNEHVAIIEAPAEGKDDEDEEGADNVRGYCDKMLLNSRAAGVDCTYDRVQEEGIFEGSYVVQEKYQGHTQGDRVRNGASALWRRSCQGGRINSDSQT